MSPGSTSTVAWASTGPVSTPASTTCTVQPVTRSPAASASRTAWAPGKDGSRAGCVLSTVWAPEDRGAEELHEPGGHDERRPVVGDPLGQGGVPLGPGRRGPRRGRRRWGCPQRPARCSPAMPARSAPTARMRTPYAGSAAASMSAWRLVPEPETRTTTPVGSAELRRASSRALTIPSAPRPRRQGAAARSLSSSGPAASSRNRCWPSSPTWTSATSVKPASQNGLTASTTASRSGPQGMRLGDLVGA